MICSGLQTFQSAVPEGNQGMRLSELLQVVILNNLWSKYQTQLQILEHQLWKTPEAEKSGDALMDQGRWSPDASLTHGGLCMGSRKRDLVQKGTWGLWDSVFISMKEIWAENFIYKGSRSLRNSLLNDRTYCTTSVPPRDNREKS